MFRWTEDPGRIHIGSDEEAELRGIGPGDDGDVVRDDVPQLKERICGVGAPAVRAAGLAKQPEVALIERIGKQATKTPVDLIAVEPRLTLTQRFSDGAIGKVRRDAARLEHEVLETVPVVEHQRSDVVDAHGCHLFQVAFERFDDAQEHHAPQARRVTLVSCVVNVRSLDMACEVLPEVPSVVGAPTIVFDERDLAVSAARSASCGSCGLEVDILGNYPGMIRFRRPRELKHACPTLVLRGE